jgi:5-methylcytosine-specific restriction endonuclease McrA
MVCANCDIPLDVRIEGLFCSELCRQTADFVRYARVKVAANQLRDPEIAAAIQVRMAMILGGGYPRSSRRLSSETRAFVVERDSGRCVLCGAPGTEVDHINGSSGDLSNLQLLCTDCHRRKTESGFSAAPPEKVAEADAIWRGRVLAMSPVRLCDDPDRWKGEWRGLKSQRRTYLLDELEDRGYDRSDFAGMSWAEMWDDIADAEAPDFGVWDDDDGPPLGATEDEIGHHYYLQDLAERDD